MNIVIVDDEKIILNAVSRVLTRAGHTVTAYGSSQEFLTDIDRLRPDFMFLDVKMPGSSGMDLVREVRSRDINSKIIMMSGYTTPEIIEAAKELGVLSFLKKPFDNINDIVKVVEDNSH